jgi:hypothetical protein
VDATAQTMMPRDIHRRLAALEARHHAGAPHIRVWINEGDGLLRTRTGEVMTRKDFDTAFPKQGISHWIFSETAFKELRPAAVSCTMIITEPNEFIAEVHDRMPVLLKPEQFDHWLSGNMGVKELKPAPNDYLQRWAVSKRDNSSKADANDATLIECVEQAI